MTSLVWFRNDLRIYDNPALAGACRDADASIAVFFLCEEQWLQHGMAPSRLSLLYRQLLLLQEELRQLNIPLLLVDAKRFAEVPEKLAEICRTSNVDSVHFSRELPHDEHLRDHHVAKMLEQEGIKLRAYHDQCLIKPGRVLTKQGEYYKTFSSFKKEWFSQWYQQGYELVGKPQPQQSGTVKIDSQPGTELVSQRLEQLDDKWRRFWPAGEDAAHVKLHRFLEIRIKSYKDDRNIPAIQGTSMLSAYLNLGILSPKQCVHGAISVNSGEIDGGSQGVQTWINELIWRDFYRHFIVGYAYVCKNKAFIEKTEQVAWRHDEEQFLAWQEGRTGYPLVDAAMRQLNKTGWMHNRLRMVAAMFLTKHLLIDWRWGERYFMENLVDGDFASNNGGWQWSASTGVDAVPYFRVFNPFRQAERFDPEARFIRKQIKELRPSTVKEIHDDKREISLGEGYPAPIVEHKAAVERVKKVFKQAQ